VVAEIDYYPWLNKQWHRKAAEQPGKAGAYDFILITQRYRMDPEKLLVPASIYRRSIKSFPNSIVQTHFDEKSGIFEIGWRLFVFSTQLLLCSCL
jgi:hypothetical protein